MKKLKEFIDAIDSAAAPPRLIDAAPAVDAAYGAFADYAKSFDGPIYGANTLPGHRDGERADGVGLANYQHYMLRKHCIGGAPFFDDEAAACITLAKAYSCAAGGPTLSGALYRRMLAAFAAPDFRPAIPTNSSYSSGDVIPAAHWAQALFDWPGGGKAHALQPGEGMALINGAFVHVGATVALCRELKSFWALYLETIRASLTLMQADARAFAPPPGAAPHWASDCGRYVSEYLTPQIAQRQDPVSLRTTMQCLEAFTGAIETLAAQTDQTLGAPSGNPLFFPGEGHRPSGSFINPALTVQTGAVIDTMLMAGWGSVRRLTHLLSGEHGGAPIDASAKDDPLGLIQWPKNAQAKLERMRRDCGLRAFVSGDATSYGVEDMWSFGLETAQRARAGLAALREIVSLELYGAVHAAKAAGADTPWRARYGGLLPGAYGTQDDARRLADAVSADLPRGGVRFAF